MFFGEDLFGNQFTIGAEDIVAFDAETAERERIASSMSEWLAAVLLADTDFRTARPIAARWQRANGPLPTGMRLMAVAPFVAGGSYELENLRAVEAADGMRFHGQVASQIQHRPEGSDVRIVVRE